MHTLSCLSQVITKSNKAQQKHSPDKNFIEKNISVNNYGKIFVLASDPLSCYVGQLCHAILKCN